MITRLLLTAILFCGLLPISRVYAKNKSTTLAFPTVEQFLALTEDQQIQYLRGLQEITSQMVHGSSLFAEYRYQYLHYFALTSSQVANAAEVSQAVIEAKRQFENFKSASSSTDEEERNRLATEPFVRLSRAFDQANREDDRVAKAEILRAYQDLQRQLSSSRGSLSAKSWNYIETQGDRLQKTVRNPRNSTVVRPKSDPQPRPHREPKDRTQKPPSQPVRTPRSDGSKAVNAIEAASPRLVPKPQPPPSAPAPAPASANEARQVIPTPAVTSNPPPAVAQPAEANFSRSGCMYAGFILISDRCDAPSTLPEQFKAKTPFDEEKFKCEKGQAICNPLLFGFDIKAPEAAEKNCEDIAQITSCYQYAVPVCTPVSRTATKECKEKTDSEKYLKRAQALIKTKKDLFTKFTDDFRTICDKDFIEQNKLIYYDSAGKKRNNPDYYKNDILSTCERAAPKFEQLYESTIGSKFNYKAAAVNGSSTSGSSAGISPSKGSNAPPSVAPPASGAASGPGKK